MQGSGITALATDINDATRMVRTGFLDCVVNFSGTSQASTDMNGKVITWRSPSFDKESVFSATGYNTYCSLLVAIDRRLLQNALYERMFQGSCSHKHPSERCNSDFKY